MDRDHARNCPLISSGVMKRVPPAQPSPAQLTRQADFLRSGMGPHRTHIHIKCIRALHRPSRLRHTCGRHRLLGWTDRTLRAAGPVTQRKERCVPLRPTAQWQSWAERAAAYIQCISAMVVYCSTPQKSSDQNVGHAGEDDVGRLHAA